MVASIVSEALYILRSLGGNNDSADQLSCRYSVFLLLGFCILVSTKQYVGEPIACWIPSNFESDMIRYTHTMCWVKNTYYIPVGELIPWDDDEARKHELYYYQWVPVVIAIQAVMFFLPHMLWLMLNVRTGCDIGAIITLYHEAAMGDETTREQYITYVTRHIDTFLMTVRKTKHNHTGPVSTAATLDTSSAGNGTVEITTESNGEADTDLYNQRVSITVLRGFVKVLYLVNCLSQLFLIGSFLGEKRYFLYGAERLKDIVLGQVLPENPVFPRSTLCSFWIRTFGGNQHRHTFQCVLTVNFFNEKFYLFFWFWLCLVALVTVVKLVFWFIELLASSRISMCQLWLKQALAGRGRKGESLNDGLVAKFAVEYLGADGALVLRLLLENVGEILTKETTLVLFDEYVEKRRFDRTKQYCKESVTPEHSLVSRRTARHRSNVLPSAPRDDTKLSEL